MLDHYQVLLRFELPHFWIEFNVFCLNSTKRRLTVRVKEVVAERSLSAVYFIENDAERVHVGTANLILRQCVDGRVHAQ